MIPAIKSKVVINSIIGFLLRFMFSTYIFNKLNTKTINKTKLYAFLLVKRIYVKMIHGNKYPIN